MHVDIYCFKAFKRIESTQKSIIKWILAFNGTLCRVKHYKMVLAVLLVDIVN